MPDINTEQKHNNVKKIILISIIIGFAVGTITSSAAIILTMPSLMFVTTESNLDFDQTVSALEKSIEDNGWVVSSVMDMNKSMAKHEVEFAPRVKLIKLCKPEYAKSVLQTDRYISTMMPCTFSVWEGDDGKVYVSKMNLSVMARIFGGNVARVMGDDVVQDEHTMLSGIIKMKLVSKLMELDICHVLLFIF